jgi:hypothetical protein
MTPFCGKPAVIVIKPSDHGTNIESTIDRVELERCAGNFGTVWNNSSFNNWAEKLCALFESQAFKTTT